MGSQQEILKALRDSESLYQSLVENIPMAVFRKDRDGRFTFVNQKFCSDANREAIDFIGKTDFDFFPQELAQKYRGDDLRVMNENQPFSDTEAYRRANGELRFMKVTKVALHDSSGHVIGIQGIASDVTEEKLAQDAQRETSEKLKRSNDDLELFARVASHDLKEPLRTIQNYLELLDRGFHHRLGAEGVEFIQNATAVAQSMRSLIDGLLSYAHVTRTKDEETSTVDCAQIMKLVVANLKASMEESGVEMCVQWLPRVKGNSVLLQHLFQNLISNSIKFRSIERLRVQVSCIEKINEYFFSIRDNGIGFDMAKVDKLFSLFGRLHDAKYSGTGIGLATCKKIVESHGGRIWAESLSGGGCTIFFTLPKLEAAPEVSNSPYLTGTRILLVDDSVDSYRIFAAIFDRTGLILQWVSGGELALATLKDENFDLIFLDLEMPGLDGFETCRRITSMGKNMPIIAYTSHDAENIKGQCLKSGFNDFLPKSVNLDQLYQYVVQRCLTLSNQRYSASLPQQN